MERACSVDCVAYEKSKYSTCKLVAGVQRLLIALRVPAQSPVAMMAPKVNP